MPTHNSPSLGSSLSGVIYSRVEPMGPTEDLTSYFAAGTSSIGTSCWGSSVGVDITPKRFREVLATPAAKLSSFFQSPAVVPLLSSAAASPSTTTARAAATVKPLTFADATPSGRSTRRRNQQRQTLADDAAGLKTVKCEENEDDSARPLFTASPAPKTAEKSILRIARKQQHQNDKDYNSMPPPPLSHSAARNRTRRGKKSGTVAGVSTALLSVAAASSAGRGEGKGRRSRSAQNCTPDPFAESFAAANDSLPPRANEEGMIDTAKMPLFSPPRKLRCEGEDVVNGNDDAGELEAEWEREEREAKRRRVEKVEEEQRQQREVEEKKLLMGNGRRTKAASTSALLEFASAVDGIQLKQEQDDDATFASPPLRRSRSFAALHHHPPTAAATTTIQLVPSEPIPPQYKVIAKREGRVDAVLGGRGARRDRGVFVLPTLPSVVEPLSRPFWYIPPALSAIVMAKNAHSDSPYFSCNGYTMMRKHPFFAAAGENQIGDTNNCDSGEVHTLFATVDAANGAHATVPVVNDAYLRSAMRRANVVAIGEETLIAIGGGDAVENDKQTKKKKSDPSAPESSAASPTNRISPLVLEFDAQPLRGFVVTYYHQPFAYHGPTTSSVEETHASIQNTKVETPVSLFKVKCEPVDEDGPLPPANDNDRVGGGNNQKKTAPVAAGSKSNKATNVAIKNKKNVDSDTKGKSALSLRVKMKQEAEETAARMKEERDKAEERRRIEMDKRQKHAAFAARHNRTAFNVASASLFYGGLFVAFDEHEAFAVSSADPSDANNAAFAHNNGSLVNLAVVDDETATRLHRALFAWVVCVEACAKQHQHIGGFSRGGNDNETKKTRSKAVLKRPKAEKISKKPAENVSPPSCCGHNVHAETEEMSDLADLFQRSVTDWIAHLMRPAGADDAPPSLIELYWLGLWQDEVWKRAVDWQERRQEQSTGNSGTDKSFHDSDFAVPRVVSVITVKALQRAIDLGISPTRVAEDAETLKSAADHYEIASAQIGAGREKNTKATASSTASTLSHPIPFPAPAPLLNILSPYAAVLGTVFARVCRAVQRFAAAQNNRSPHENTQHVGEEAEKGKSAAAGCIGKSEADLRAASSHSNPLTALGSSSPRHKPLPTATVGNTPNARTPLPGNQYFCFVDEQEENCNTRTCVVKMKEEAASSPVHKSSLAFDKGGAAILTPASRVCDNKSNPLCSSETTTGHPTDVPSDPPTIVVTSRAEVEQTVRQLFAAALLPAPPSATTSPSFSPAVGLKGKRSRSKASSRSSLLGLATLARDEEPKAAVVSMVPQVRVPTTIRYKRRDSGPESVFGGDRSPSMTVVLPPLEFECGKQVSNEPQTSYAIPQTLPAADNMQPIHIAEIAQRVSSEILRERSSLGKGGDGVHHSQYTILPHSRKANGSTTAMFSNNKCTRSRAVEPMYHRRVAFSRSAETDTSIEGSHDDAP